MQWMRSLGRHAPIAVCVVLALVLASTGKSQTTAARVGGTVTILDTAGGVDSLDPGYWYYQTDYEELGQTTQRWLYGWKPTDTSPTPDLATGMPQISDGGKRLTIGIRDGVRYSPPLQSRTVTSADIKYAMERCFAASVANGYALYYYWDIVGTPSAPTSRVPNISGIQTPDAHTLVLKLDRPVGVLATAGALALPCTAPVPQDYAAQYDSGPTSTYGEHEVFTGPYMIEGAGSGTVPTSGYQPGRLLVLVRNPSWDASTDFRPAYFDKIVETNGGDSTDAARQVLGGSAMMSGDSAVPPPSILKQYLPSARDQFQIAPSGGNRYISLNSRIRPFDNVNVRRAVAAVIDRQALRETRGGQVVGTLATHFLPPGVPGFREAGGTRSSYDFYAHPRGSVALARRYMRKAGYPSGRYTGRPVLAVADNQAPGSRTADAVKRELKTIGIKLTLRRLPHAAMLTKCQTPKAHVALCPNLGWGKDFFDPETMLDPVYNMRNIVQSGNVNTALVNDPRLNARLNSAASVTDAGKRARLYGRLDKSLAGRAYYITWLWDDGIDFASKDVNGVPNAFNGNSWDLAFSSLK
jgi:peptide/nickel transport system substrate-binding protein